MSEDETLDLRIGMILNDFLDRKKRGERVSDSELFARYPDLADELREHLELLRGLEPAEDVIADLLARGMLARSSDQRYLADLGAYKIVGLIGRGGMGIVLKAYESSLNRTVALKIMRPELGHDETALRRFAREAKAAGSLRHPNIVTVHAIGRASGSNYLAMEFIDGVTLATLIQDEGPLSTETARRIFRELLGGLCAAHQENLIHRDIKSSNILLDGEQQGVKIADFGLARITSAQTRLTRPDSLLGTPEYMSPEQARGDEDIDHRTDLYSAGVVLYEMLTGRTPFRAETPSAILHKILHDEPPEPSTINSNVDPTLTTIALRLMAKSPDDRFATAAEALEVVEANEPVRAPRRPRSFQRYGAAALIVPAILAIAWLASRSPRHVTQITAVQIDQDTQRAVQVRYGNEASWSTFGNSLVREDISLQKAIVVDVDGRGRQLVVAGSRASLDEDGSVLIAFDRHRKEQWRIPLHSMVQWPDCDTPSWYWPVRNIFAVGLEGEPGEAVGVVASDPHDYPTRLSLIDPHTGKETQSFWHFGHINGVMVLPSFFPDGRPAILAWGLNNKLDGFNDGVRYDELQLAHWDQVSVIMILDPSELEGLGPPLTHRMPGTKSARPYAYAFLDRACEVGTSYVPEKHPAEREMVVKDLTAHDIAYLESVQIAPRRGDDGSDPWFELYITAHLGGGKMLRGPYLTVDRHLKLRHVERKIFPTARERGTRAFWERHWKRVVEKGQYIGHGRSD